MKNLPSSVQAKFGIAQRGEWKKHIDHSIFTLRWDLDKATLIKDGKNVLALFFVNIDSNEGKKGFTQMEIAARARLVTPDFRDLDNPWA